METIRYLLGVIVKLVIMLFLLAFILWIVGFVYPDLRPSKIFSTDVFRRDWLPAPRNLLFSGSNNTKRNQFVPGPSYNNYAPQSGVEFVAYTDSGKKVIPSTEQGLSQNYQGRTAYTYADRSLYVRNLSVYEGGNISYGQTIYGEARGTMFTNGSFTVLVVDGAGRLVASMPAINTGTWAIPGWGRFQVTISSSLPANSNCTLIFQSANQPLRITVPVRCN